MSIQTKPTQNQRILDYIAEFGSITQIQALQDLGCMRLASRISDLRRQGHNITSELVEVKNRYGEKCRIKRYSMGGTGMNEQEKMFRPCMECRYFVSCESGKQIHHAAVKEPCEEFETGAWVYE